MNKNQTLPLMEFTVFLEQEDNRQINGLFQCGVIGDGLEVHTGALGEDKRLLLLPRGAPGGFSGEAV